MTNAEKLIKDLTLVGTNVNHEPLVALESAPFLGEFIIRQGSIRLSLGVPCIETQLFDANSGKLVYTARDMDGFGDAESHFSQLEWNCSQLALVSAKAKNKAIVDAIGFLS